MSLVCIRVVIKAFFYFCIVSTVFPRRFFVLNNMVFSFFPPKVTYSIHAKYIFVGMFPQIFDFNMICNSISTKTPNMANFGILTPTCQSQKERSLIFKSFSMNTKPINVRKLPTLKQVFDFESYPQHYSYYTMYLQPDFLQRISPMANLLNLG